MERVAKDVHTQIGERRLTPMLRQYIEAKTASPPEAILLFRMGDFFELFFDDARVAARELDLTLTSRDKDSADPIPMAGVPHHAVGGYIARLVERGFTVAVCDQVEDPKQAKGIVRREITRVVTPGTISDLEALDPGAANYLACLPGPRRPAPANGSLAVALLDILGGEILCTRVPMDTLGDELRRMGAREILVGAAVRPAVSTAIGSDLPIREIDRDPPPSEEMAAALTARFGSANVEGLGEDTNDEDRWAVLGLLEFAESTQRRRLRYLMPPRAYRIDDYLVLDEATRHNLELCRTMDGTRKGSLLWHLDRCRTAMGSRTVAQWLLFPLVDELAIKTRLDMVGALRDERVLRGEVRELLEPVRDVERLVGRIAVGRANPRDLAALRDSLAVVPSLKGQMANHPSPLGKKWGTADEVGEARDLLAVALADDPPVGTSDGGIFAPGFRADLDELIAAASDGHTFLHDLEERERRRTNIPKLKVRYNRVFGYYIEVSRANAGLVPDDYVRKQTLVNAERYITPELKEYETRVLGADERRKAREEELFGEICDEIAGHTRRLRALARLVAETDAVCSLAQVADEGRYTRPVLTTEPVLQLRQSRHPVLERLLPGGERFVPNDVDIDARTRQLLIVTGPNMAGKSTLMRQTALCSILAHMGSFVPAKAARIGLCDRVFTRVGASDNLGRGHSTFMVEMIETGAILRYATARSLVILDEIGRGTSTFDGVSIAWAVAEYLHDELGCRTLFATHYHELTDLAVERPRVINVSTAVKEQRGRIVFLRRLVEGASNRSYGIEVARLAGLPDVVLERSRQILANLERGELDERGLPSLARSVPRTVAGGTDQLSLFSAAGPNPEYRAVAEELGRLDPMQMTPIEALTALDRLKSLLAGDEKG